MLSRILTPEHAEIVSDERQLLADIQLALSREGSTQDDRQILAASIRQLDELFMLVVVGEFNAGKSAFLNSLLGRSILTEGVTPTTSAIHLIQYGDEMERETLEAEVERVLLPVELLREVTLVDTPGTNALDRRHEALTAEFVPRSDLVLFVTSADRPFSESERAFLEKIREWGKKVVVIVNKIDILTGREQVDEIRTYITEHGRRLLQIEPRVFMMSARQALAAQETSDDEALEASGLTAVEHHLHTSLDTASRIRLKLENPLGVADRLLTRQLEITDGRLELLADDLTTLDDIERQLGTYSEDVEREFGFRLSDIDNELHQLEKRGLEFFDETLRLGRLTELFNKEKVRTEFERIVVAETPQTIESKVESLIDWMVESDLNQWQAVVQHVNRRRSHHADRMVGEVGGRFEYDRSGLLETVGRAARDGLQSYDRAAEARRMAEDVQKAVAGTALVEVGAVGLGATIALIASGTVADATGLIAAGLLAALGLFILPSRRRRAKRELKEKISRMRQELMGALGERFRNEAGKSQSRIREAVAPYIRFVRTERDRLGERQTEIGGLRGQIKEMKTRVNGLAQSADPGPP